MKKTKNINLKTEWDLTLLYKSINDSKIDADLDIIEKAYIVFEKKYKVEETTYMTNDSALHEALLEYEKINDLPSHKGYRYLRMSQDLDSKNQAVRSRFTQLVQRSQKIGNIILFFELNLSKISSANQKVFLKSEKLSPYTYFLKKIFDESKFLLSLPEEKILKLKSLPSHGMWTDAIKKMRGQLTVMHKNKIIPVSEAEALIRQLPNQTERKELYGKVMDQYESIASMSDSELNAIVTNKKINDELRGYEMPYDATILSYENNKKTVLGLVETVTQNFNVSQRFYKIKKKMLGLKKMGYYDRAVSVGKTKKKITFDIAYETLYSIFNSLNSEFASILERFVKNGQVDVYPKVGKAGGAYCWGDHKSPTFVFLNHVDNLDSLMTFAHEMGHGIHTEFSKKQPVFYDGYSTATAEVASTLFEMFVFYDQFEKLSKEEQIIALHDKIQDDVQTIFRQIACFNFELDMHTKIREKGYMSKEELGASMNKHMKSYIGDVTLDEKDGYFFVAWPHIRNFFYVYSYAFGQLASKALYAKYKEDPMFMEKIKQFLSLGGSMSPEDIFKSIGVDVTKPDFFEKGIKTIEDDIVLLEKLTSKKK
ncbi:MAG: M3 family oligoendopeptidase [Minisyncoccota bacterium]